MRRKILGNILFLLLLLVVFNSTAEAIAGKIAFASGKVGGGNGEIYVMNADGTNQTRLTDNPANDTLPSISPDGTKIAFKSYRDYQGEIYVMDADGTNLTRLTNNSDREWISSSCWSPDGTKITFSLGPDGNRDIYVMNADGSNQVRLTDSSADELLPSWSPDGAKIVFSSQEKGGGPSSGDDAEIYIMDTDGTNKIQLTDNQAQDFYPSFSPDGTKIAFISDRDGNFEIYIMNADGTNQTPLTNNDASDVYLSFSPDGTKIAFTSFRDGNPEIYTMDINGNNQINITNNPAAEDGFPSWGIGSVTLPPGPPSITEAHLTNATRPGATDIAIGEQFKVTAVATSGLTNLQGVIGNGDVPPGPDCVIGNYFNITEVSAGNYEYIGTLTTNIDVAGREASKIIAAVGLFDIGIVKIADEILIVEDNIANEIDTEPDIFSVYFTDGPPSYDGKTSATSGGTTYGEVISKGLVKVIDLPNPDGIRVIALADNVKVITCANKVETTLAVKGDSADILCNTTTVTANILNIQDVNVKIGQPYTDKKPTIQAKLPAGNTITLKDPEVVVPSTNPKSTLIEVLKNDENVLYTVNLPAYLLTNITIVENPDFTTTVTVISGNATITDSIGAIQTIKTGESASLDENGVFLVVSPIQMIKSIISKLEEFEQEIDQSNVKKERAYISLIDTSIILLKSSIASLEKEHKRAAVVKIMASQIILKVMIQVMEKDRTLPNNLRVVWTEKCNTIISDLTSIIKIIMPKEKGDKALEKEAEEEANKYLERLNLEEIESKDVLNVISCYTYPNPYIGAKTADDKKEKYTSSGIKFRYEAVGDIQKVTIEIYNIKGKLIDKFQDYTIDGEANYDFADRLANGVYIYRITISDDKKAVSKTGKIVVLK